MTAEGFTAARARLAPAVERARSFSGWLPDVESRRLTPGPPWDYGARAGELAAFAGSMVDLGTGGGERFAAICGGIVARAIATESWHVNAVVAQTRLRSLGIDVVLAGSLDLPFRGETFDLVLDRHEELAPREVARVLRPGGRLLTQQVTPDSWKELGTYLPRRTDFGDHFHTYQQELREAGLEIIDARLHEYRRAYSGLPDFVYMLCIAPWEVPDFDPLGSDLEALLALERDLMTSDGLVLTEGRYIIEAIKKHA